MSEDPMLDDVVQKFYAAAARQKQSDAEKAAAEEEARVRSKDLASQWRHAREGFFNQFNSINSSIAPTGYSMVYRLVEQSNQRLGIVIVALSGDDLHDDAKRRQLRVTGHNSGIFEAHADTGNSLHLTAGIMDLPRMSREILLTYLKEQTLD